MNYLANGVSVLLVEDDDVDAVAIERNFRNFSIDNQLIRARDGVEALELLRSGKVPGPYIILLDLQMPRMRGIEFLSEIRHDAQLNSSIVFVLTTSKNIEDVTASYRHNIVGYFLKNNLDENCGGIVGMLQDHWSTASVSLGGRG
tara:strand:+ start:375 stop:809 length:435 start_codon:yes stop_codon:yes gene_type:complete